jgi:hypothetical protein
MKSDPEQAADRHARAVIIAVISFIFSAAILLALVTTIHGIDTRLASNDAPPGTTGLARPHPPLDRARASQHETDCRRRHSLTGDS